MRRDFIECEGARDTPWKAQRSAAHLAEAVPEGGQRCSPPAISAGRLCTGWSAWVPNAVRAPVNYTAEDMYSVLGTLKRHEIDLELAARLA